MNNLQMGWANTETPRFMHPLLFSPILGSSFSGMKDCCYRLSSGQMLPLKNIGPLVITLW